MNRSNFDTQIPEFLVLCNECKSLGFCRARDPKRFKMLHGSTAHEAAFIDLRKYKVYQKKVKDLVNYLPLDLQKQFDNFNLGTDKENLQCGIAAFEAEEYKVAVNYLEPLSTYHELKCKLSLFIAISQFMLGDYNAAGYYFTLINFDYQSKLEKEVEEVIGICERLSKEKVKAEIAVDDLFHKCMSDKKEEVFQH